MSPVEGVGLGSGTVDFFALVPQWIGAEEKINATRLEIHAGGVSFQAQESADQRKHHAGAGETLVRDRFLRPDIVHARENFRDGSQLVVKSVLHRGEQSDIPLQ